MTKTTKSSRTAAQVEDNKVALEHNPLRMLKLIARASEGNYCSSLRIFNGNSDPSDLVTPQIRVEFIFYPRDTQHGPYIAEHKLYLFGEKYEYDFVEQEFDLIDATRKAEQERLKLARETWDSLTDAQRKALNLKFRP